MMASGQANEDVLKTSTDRENRFGSTAAVASLGECVSLASVSRPPATSHQPSLQVESKMGAVAGAYGHHPVSHLRSSNRRSRFPESGF